MNGVIALELVKDDEGKIVGSEGYFQDKLFYMTDRLNLTVKTVESLKERGAPAKNGSWTGCIGMLQRGEIDVDSYGRGIYNIPLGTILI